MQSPIPNRQSPIHNALLPPSTGIDTMQQSSTKHNENSCAHAREGKRDSREGGNLHPSLPSIPEAYLAQMKFSHSPVPPISATLPSYFRTPTESRSRGA